MTDTTMIMECSYAGDNEPRHFNVANEKMALLMAVGKAHIDHSIYMFQLGTKGENGNTTLFPERNYIGGKIKTPDHVSSIIQRLYQDGSIEADSCETQMNWIKQLKAKGLNDILVNAAGFVVLRATDRVYDKSGKLIYGQPMRGQSMNNSSAPNALTR